MQKYINALVEIIFAWIKLIKLKCFRRGECYLLSKNRIAPSTEISVSSKGRIRIGKGIIIKKDCGIFVRNQGVVTIGDGFFMNRFSMITAWDDIRIGDNVQFGPGVLVYDQDHDYRAKGGLASEQYTTSPIEIGNNVWIGANTIILKGSKIGSNSVIAAGSIIKGNIPDNMLFYQERKSMMKEIVES